MTHPTNDRKSLEKQIERFEQLIRVMRGLTRHERAEHFDMGHWGEETDCGTTMCAAGFCGSDPWFRRRGFKLMRGEFNLHPVYRDYMDWRAIQAFFGVLPGDGEDTTCFTRADIEQDISRLHPVFAKPNSVGEVIKAAHNRIKILQANLTALMESPSDTA